MLHVDRLVPSYRNTLAISCLQFYLKLMLASFTPIDFALFLPFTRCVEVPPPRLTHTARARTRPSAPSPLTACCCSAACKTSDWRSTCSPSSGLTSRRSSVSTSARACSTVSSLSSLPMPSARSSPTTDHGPQSSTYRSRSTTTAWCTRAVRGLEAVPASRSTARRHRSSARSRPCASTSAPTRSSERLYRRRSRASHSPVLG